MAPKSLLTGAVVVLVAGCSLPPRNASNQFDPRADALDDPKGPAFTSVSSGRSISPSMLSPDSGSFTLGPGDQLDIEIEGQPDTRDQTIVMPDGLVYYHLAEGVPADGQTVEELKSSLTQELSKFEQNPLLRVTLTDVKSRNYWIMGQVNSPGIYPLNQPITLLDAVARAGGVDNRTGDANVSLANLESSYMVRNGEVMPVDLDLLIQHGDMSQNVYLEPGDYIYVPSSQDASVYVLGSVQRPLSVGFRGNLTIVSALAEAGGFSPTAYQQKVVIIRGALYEPRVAVVDVASIMQGKETNFKLRPGDIVWVAQSPFELTKNFAIRVVDAAARALAVSKGIDLVYPDSARGASIGIN